MRECVSRCPTHSWVRAPGALMAIDGFVLERLASVKQTFEELTNLLGDPSIDSKELLRVSKERAKLSVTVLFCPTLT